MTRPLLAIDAGTTGVTALLFDTDLVPIAKAYREFEQHFPRPGRVEHDAATILASVDATVTEVLTHAPRGVEAIGITNQRETVFALDVERGEALGRGIVWQDRRTSERCEELRNAGHGPEVAARTGLVLDPYFSATKIEWMLREIDPVRERAGRGAVRFATVDALIVHHLTGGALLATEPTNASRTMLYDIDARRWSPELCELFGVDPAWLPEVRASNAEFGRCARYGIDAPLHGIAGDQQAALFGQGCWDEGSFKNTYGTGCFLLLNTGAQRRDSSRGLLTTLAATARGEVCYALEGSVFSGGLVLQWLRDGLGLIDSAAESEALASSVPDTGGVHLVPAFAGLGAPYWDADARAAILGMTRGTNSAHLARAALEALAFQCAEIVELLREETGLAIAELRVDGGASANALLMQMQADFAGLDVVRSANLETTARGAAALAGTGLGLWSEPGEAGAFREGATRFSAVLDGAERSARLASWRRAVARVRTNA